MNQWRTKGFFQFENNINVLVGFFRLISIGHTCVYGHYIVFKFFSAGIDFRRQNLTPEDNPRAERVKYITPLYHRLSIYIWLIVPLGWAYAVHVQLSVFLSECPFNPLTAKLFNLNFHPLEVVSRCRDPQLQVSENYSDLTKWRSTVFKYC